jgi:hypothetical protein
MTFDASIGASNVTIPPSGFAWDGRWYAQNSTLRPFVVAGYDRNLITSTDMHISPP